MYTETEENRFLEVTYANGDKEVLYFKDFNSGAMIQNIVDRAKKMAIKDLLDHDQQGLRVQHLLQACVDEFKENEDLPNTTNPDDWARISGKKGERIVFIRTLITGKQGTEPGRSIDTVANTGSVPLSLHGMGEEELERTELEARARDAARAAGRRTTRRWSTRSPTGSSARGRSARAAHDARAGAAAPTADRAAAGRGSSRSASSRCVAAIPIIGRSAWRVPSGGVASPGDGRSRWVRRSSASTLGPCAVPGRRPTTRPTRVRRAHRCGLGEPASGPGPQATRSVQGRGRPCRAGQCSDRGSRATSKPAAVTSARDVAAEVAARRQTRRLQRARAGAATRATPRVGARPCSRTCRAIAARPQHPAYLRQGERRVGDGARGVNVDERASRTTRRRSSSRCAVEPASLDRAPSSAPRRRAESRQPTSDGSTAATEVTAGRVPA